MTTPIPTNVSAPSLTAPTEESREGNMTAALVTPTSKYSDANRHQFEENDSSDSTPESSPTESTPFMNLFSFLGIRFESTDAAELSILFSELGVETVDDLGLLEEKDFERLSSISPVSVRKLLHVIDFIRNGGSIDGFSRYRDLVKFVKAEQAPSACVSDDKNVKSIMELDSVVALNVGGNKFTASRDTLSRFPGSFLESLVSGRHLNPACKDKEGAYFICRDGTHFPHILNFLRVGTVVTLPKEAAAREALVVEADFYGLDELVRAITCPKIDIDDFLDEETIKIRKEEDVLREAFAAGSAAVFDPHRGLIPLFCPDDGPPSLPLTYQPESHSSEIHCLLMKNLRMDEATDNTPVTVGELSKFETNFNREHPNMLHRLSEVLREEPVVIAGGAVLRGLTSSSGICTANWWGNKSDIDMFLHCSNVEEANRIARRIWYALTGDNEA